MDLLIYLSQPDSDLIDIDTTLIEEVWEEQPHVQMEIRRMIIYLFYVVGAIMKNGWYKDDPRISLSGFVFARKTRVDVMLSETNQLFHYILHSGNVLYRYMKIVNSLKD